MADFFKNAVGQELKNMKNFSRKQVSVYFSMPLCLQLIKKQVWLKK